MSSIGSISCEGCDCFGNNSSKKKEKFTQYKLNKETDHLIMIYKKTNKKAPTRKTDLVNKVESALSLIRKGNENVNGVIIPKELLSLPNLYMVSCSDNQENLIYKIGQNGYDMLAKCIQTIAYEDFVKVNDKTISNWIEKQSTH